MLFLARNLTARSSFWDSDLSQNKSLRTLEVVARTIVSRYGDHTPNLAISTFLKTTLSTITSPVFSEVVVSYRDYDFAGVEFSPHLGSGILRNSKPAGRAKEASWHRGLFKMFRKMYTVRNFRLVLCADVWDYVGEYTVGMLKCAVAAEKAAERLDYLPSEPLVICSPRGSPEGGWDIGTPDCFVDW